MLDIFLQKDLRALFKNKTIVFMGDSNIRALYKDFLCLMHESYIISEERLKAKMEKSIYNDKLIFHGARNNGRDYKEERQINSCLINASFYFITRVYDDYVKSVLKRITADRDPDVLVINSCLWDVTRWGASGVKDYKSNLLILMRHLQRVLPDCLVIWVTAPPISSEVRGGFLVADLQFLKYSLRFHVVEANHYARQVVVEHGFDVLDTHYHLKNQIHRRADDGVHWNTYAVRYVLNLLLTHISLAWNVPLPHRYSSLVMEEYLEKLEDELSMVEPKIVKVQAPQSTQQKPKAKKKSKKKSPRKNLGSLKSHHAYTTSTWLKERHQRIKRWQASVNSTYTPHSQYNSPAVSQHSTPGNSQHDSGYFPSPSTEAYLSNDSSYSHRNITFSSPQFSQSSSYNTHRSSGREVHQWQVQTETYYPSNVHSSSNSVQCYTSGYHYQNGRALQVPYSFPHVAQGQVLQPRIDFTADDFAVFSV
ncbi:hypothetical protein JTE90_018493 [Oedothorax gibbosus]|uniref:Uncharacterized protein n=1 Tax=Oedothorax gibbosus TaxID=931172 RepID=A0AAV6UZE4_9ARAC|nr:hypothetical protein JTE90_018493 [Oedothorax gibbosus]